MSTKSIGVEITPHEELRRRTITFTTGEYKPANDELKIWFESLWSFAHVLIDNNLMLLRVIEKMNKKSLVNENRFNLKLCA